MDDGGFNSLLFIQPKGSKSRAKKAKQRVWFDENRENPEQQFMLKLYFRVAHSRLHIVQVKISITTGTTKTDNCLVQKEGPIWLLFI